MFSEATDSFREAFPCKTSVHTSILVYYLCLEYLTKARILSSGHDKSAWKWARPIHNPNNHTNQPNIIINNTFSKNGHIKKQAVKCTQFSNVVILRFLQQIQNC